MKCRHELWIKKHVKNFYSAHQNNLIQCVGNKFTVILVQELLFFVKIGQTYLIISFSFQGTCIINSVLISITEVSSAFTSWLTGAFSLFFNNTDGNLGPTMSNKDSWHGVVSSILVVAEEWWMIMNDAWCCGIENDSFNVTKLNLNLQVSGYFVGYTCIPVLILLFQSSMKRHSPALP